MGQPLPSVPNVTARSSKAIGHHRHRNCVLTAVARDQCTAARARRSRVYDIDATAHSPRGHHRLNAQKQLHP